VSRSQPDPSPDSDRVFAASSDSERMLAARSRARERLTRQRATLRPLGWAVILVVLLASANSQPAPGLHGKGLAITLALVVFGTGLLVVIGERFPERPVGHQAGVIAVIGAAGVALAGLQLKGATEVAAGVAAFVAVTRLPYRLGMSIAAAVTVALGAVTAIAGASASAVAAAILLTILLGVVAQFLKRSRQSEDRTERLLAQLEDARDEQARAAALAERGRIAGELHDVLAHSLSGAAIQLQGARKLADREQASAAVSAAVSAAIDRASELVRAGLADARRAVGALRGDPLPSVAQLPSLIDSYRADMNLDVTLRIEGPARPLPPDPGLALYRGAQEALTNVARYAPSACTTVTVSYEPDRTRVSVDNGRSDVPPQHGVGGGRGLEGMRARIEQAGGSMSAGPTDDGWRVEIEVPA
jgi:signal transduction histidine kinase